MSLFDFLFGKKGKSTDLFGDLNMSLDPIEDAAEILAGAEHVMAFTGAGMSAESSIPTFRDPGGIWDRFDPSEVGTTEGIVNIALHQPERIREFLRESVATFRGAEPNPGHYALAELERMGILKSIVTQNIDDLHSIAGNTRIFEVHGNLYRFRCVSCNFRVKYTRDEILDSLTEMLAREPFTIQKLLDALPKCPKCGSLMRPDVVMFGEAVHMMAESFEEARKSDVVLVLGTSGMVWPAAGVPYEASKGRAKVIEVNPTANAFRDITTVYVKGLSGEEVPSIVDLVKELR